MWEYGALDTVRRCMRPTQQAIGGCLFPHKTYRELRGHRVLPIIPVARLKIYPSVRWFHIRRNTCAGEYSRLRARFET